MNLEWVQSSDGEIPENAFETGAHDENGETLFIARGIHADGIHPGRLGVGQKGAHIPASGKEHLKTKYEVLASIAGLYWKSTSVGDLPTYAVPTGHNIHKTPLYSAKGMIDGYAVIGKYNYKDQKVLFPCGGLEHYRGPGEKIEILCFKVCLVCEPKQVAIIFPTSSQSHFKNQILFTGDLIYLNSNIQYT